MDVSSRNSFGGGGPHNGFPRRESARSEFPGTLAKASVGTRNKLLEYIRSRLPKDTCSRSPVRLPGLLVLAGGFQDYLQRAFRRAHDESLRVLIGF